MDKENKYNEVLEQAKALVAMESDMIANMANIAALVHEAFGYWWVGFYRTIGEELVLGPYQGPLACTRIKKGKGVCGHALAQGQTVVVEDVEKFPGHIACSALSRSEIVVPIWKGTEIAGVLDIDSRNLNEFSDLDALWLEKICGLLGSM